MDVNLEGMNGIEATRRVLAEAPSVRVLAFSSNSDEQTVRKMLAAGASGYLLKGGDKTELAIALHTILEGRRFVSRGIGGSQRWPGHD
jgi:DNA-binding NarL/FixJ family response regulator